MIDNDWVKAALAGIHSILTNPEPVGCPHDVAFIDDEGVCVSCNTQVKEAGWREEWRKRKAVTR